MVKSCKTRDASPTTPLHYKSDPTFAPATVAPARISPTTKSKSEGDDWVLVRDRVRITIRIRIRVKVGVIYSQVT